MLKIRSLSMSIIAVLGTLLGSGASADLEGDMRHLQDRWAEINYQLEGKAQESAFSTLVTEAEGVVAANPNAAEAWIWSGIIKSTYAGAKGGLGALSLAKESRADLEKAITLDPNALQGSAYTSLGALYYSVPGWPLGFGDPEKAEELLKHALEVNPTGIDSNYFYGRFLITEKRYDEARLYLEKAQVSPGRPGRALADSGRQREIQEALDSIEGK
jgi:cytochrome c-type biogenesis protein CcmH/NrfG